MNHREQRNPFAALLNRVVQAGSRRGRQSNVDKTTG